MRSLFKFLIAFVLIASLVNLVSAQFPEYLRDELVAWYSFDDNAENIVSNNYHLDSNGTYIGSTGLIGNALNNTWVTGEGSQFAAFNTSTYHNFTMCAWINYSGSGNQFIWGVGAETDGLAATPYNIASNFYSAFTSGGTEWVIGAANASYEVREVPVVNNTWEYICGVYNDTGLIFYRNAVYTALDSTGSIKEKDTFRVTLGNNYGNLTDTYWNGRIDEAAFWNRQLNASEISTLYNSGSGMGYEPEYISFNYPDDNFETGRQEVTFNCSGNFSNIINLSMFIDGLVNLTITNTTASQSYLDFETTISNFAVGSHTWTCNATNLSNYEYSTSVRNFSVGESFVEKTFIFNSTAYETTIESFTINFETADSATLATLVHNGTEYTGVISSLGNNNYTATTTISLPLVPSDQNVSHYWSIVTTNASGITYHNSSQQNQTILITNLSQCGAGARAINFTIYDEENNARIAANLDATFSWTLYEEGTVKKNYSIGLSGNSEYLFCIVPNATYYTDATIYINNSGYVSRTYELEKEAYSNITTNHSLFLLSENSSTSFIVFVRDSTYAAVSSAIVEIQRYYPSTSEYVTVESIKTNAEGKSIGHFVVEDILYRFQVYIDGELEYTSLPTKVFCEESPCTITLTLPSSVDEAIAEEIEGLDSDLTYSKTTHIITYTYADSNDNASGGRLYVVSWDFGIGSQNVICNTTSADASAILTCDLSSYGNGTYWARGYITRNHEQLAESVIIKKVTDIVTNVGLEGLLWAVFLIIALVMLGLFKPVLAIVFSIVGVIGISLIGFASIPIVSLVAFIFIGIVFLWEMRK